MKDSKNQQRPNQNQNAPRQIFQEDIVSGNVKPRHLVPNPSEGDIYYAHGSDFIRLGIGTAGQQLMVIGGVPTWSSFPKTGLATNRPSIGRFTGDMYFATDTFVLSAWTGAAWKSTTLA